jgi:hypothetical protein
MIHWKNGYLKSLTWPAEGLAEASNAEHWLTKS